MSAAVDPALASLTSEQLVASGTPLRRTYIEASPGSGKTTGRPSVLAITGTLRSQLITRASIAGPW